MHRILLLSFLLIWEISIAQEKYEHTYTYRHELKNNIYDSALCDITLLMDFEHKTVALIDEKTKNTAWLEIKDFYKSKGYLHVFGMDKKDNLECTIDVYTFPSYHRAYFRYQKGVEFKLTK